MCLEERVQVGTMDCLRVEEGEGRRKGQTRPYKEGRGTRRTREELVTEVVYRNSSQEEKVKGSCT